MLGVLLGIVYHGLVFGVGSAIVAVILSPAQYVKVVKQELVLGYMRIITQSYNSGGLRIFFRGCGPYALMQFVSSFSFGVAEYLSNIIILSMGSGILLSVTLRAILGGALETVTTVYYEMQEIARNKGDLLLSKVGVSQVFFVIFLRNILFWLAPSLSFELTSHFSLSYGEVFLLSCVLGLLAGIITTPLDVIATKNCGGTGDLSVLFRLRNIVRQGELEVVFAGAYIRVAQIMIYSIQAAFIELWLTK